MARLILSLSLLLPLTAAAAPIDKSIEAADDTSVRVLSSEAGASLTIEQETGSSEEAKLTQAAASSLATEIEQAIEGDWLHEACVGAMSGSVCVVETDSLRLELVDDLGAVRSTAVLDWPGAADLRSALLVAAE